MADFTPLNALEAALQQAQAGETQPSELFAALHGAQVFVLVDRELGPGGAWTEDTSLLVLQGPSGAPVVAVFSAPERAKDWPERAPAFRWGLLVDFRWLLQGVSPQAGIVVNPDCEVGVELTTDILAKLRQAAATDGPATH